MTLLIGKQCLDGTLLVADSIGIPNQGPLLRNEVKAFHGSRNGKTFAMVFGGYGGTDGGIQTIDVLRQAALTGTSALQDAVRDAMRARLEDEANNGDWKDASGVDDDLEREAFRKHQDITVLVSLHSTQLWVIRVTAADIEMFQPAGSNSMVITCPGKNSVACAQLQAARTHHPETIAQAIKGAAALFQSGSMLFPRECSYPATVLRHTAAGVTQFQYGDFAALNSSGGNSI